MTDAPVAEKGQQLTDSLRELWRDCMETVRRGAAPGEWEALQRRLAEIERKL